ncbi:MAG: hypothetical protein ISS78_05490 [Phycisphaerae bacterium]|nr:hypothetical protein [Phycisphaerae bacterium]
MTNILRATARRVALMRAAEAGAVAAIAGGLAAAALQVAWTIAPRYPLAAAGICFLPLLAGVVVFALPGRLRILGVEDRIALVIGGTCIGIGAAGIWAVQAGWYEHVSKALVAVTLMPVAGLAGAVVRALRPVRPTDAAILRDLHYDRRERLSTAAELVAGRTRDGAVAEYVCSQAAAALRGQSDAIRPPWRRTGTTAALLVLVAVLCVVLSVSAGLSSPARLKAEAAVAVEMRKMSPSEQDDLLARLHKARARQGAATLQQKLTQAEQALQDGDAGKLTQLIRALIEAGVDVRALFGKKMLEVATGRGAKGGAPPETQTATVAVKPVPAAPAPAYVYVYHPAYARLLAAGAKGGTDSQPATSVGNVLVPFDAAWDAARIRAENNLARSRSKIPPQYHQLIRDFFAEGDQAGG